MSRVRVAGLSVSLDGYAAGPAQSVRDPLGQGGTELHKWLFKTHYVRDSMGQPGGTDGLDNEVAERMVHGIGATIMGRNMFGPVRGPWEGGEWTAGPWNGWWGDEPPWHHDVFVLTHYPRPAVRMRGGTTFHFVTEGIRVALDRALEAAGGADVHITGGARTVRQYLEEGLIDELSLVIVPVLLGSGERLFEGGVGAGQGYRCVDLASSQSIANVVLTRLPGQ